MTKPTTVLTALLVAASALAQSSGARGGVHDPMLRRVGWSDPDPSVIDRFITITGRSEVRQAPTSLRVVFAVTTQASKGAACHEQMTRRLALLDEALKSPGTDQAAIVHDYISLLPVYSWSVERQHEQQVMVEKQTGYVLQYNVHLRVRSEEQAQAAIARALQIGIGDVLAVDHWSNELDSAKVEAQKRALAEAQRKAALLLGALFDKRPRPINIHEHTVVRYPKDLYPSFQNARAAALQQPNWRTSLPSVTAFKPRNTYYHGFFEHVDTQANALPMSPEISVVSTVKLYFAAPATPKTK